MSNLTFYERQLIESMLRNGAKIKSISIITGRDHSVVSREIKRNRGDYLPYNARTAQEVADRRARKTNKRKLDKNKFLRDYVVEKLKESWSPEQIAGRLKNHPPPKLNGVIISHEQIYEYIYADGQDEFGQKLYGFLRRKQPLRQKRYSRKSHKQTILGRISINQRPQEINERLTYGHWESDTLLGKYRQGVTVQYERKSQLVRVQKLPNLKAESTKQAIHENIVDLPDYLRLSITHDNGSENADHYKLRDDLNLQTYFCDPYSAWQKGGVENANGLLREYIPKRADLNNYTDNDIRIIQEKLNNRPRKKLQFLSPNEIINNEILVH